MLAILGGTWEEGWVSPSESQFCNLQSQHFCVLDRACWTLYVKLIKRDGSEVNILALYFSACWRQNRISGNLPNSARTIRLRVVSFTPKRLFRKLMWMARTWWPAHQPTAHNHSSKLAWLVHQITGTQWLGRLFLGQSNAVSKQIPLFARLPPNVRRRSSMTRSVQLNS